MYTDTCRRNLPDPNSYSTPPAALHAAPLARFPLPARRRRRAGRGAEMDGRQGRRGERGRAFDTGWHHPSRDSEGSEAVLSIQVSIIPGV